MIIDRPTRGNVQEYVEHLKKHDTSMVVRVCEPTYDDGVFEKEGIIVHVSTTVTPITINKLCVQGSTVQGSTVQGSTVHWSTVQSRHTDNSRSPSPDIAVPRQALCYLSRSNRSLKNRRLFLQHPLFLALVNPENHKPQNAEPSKRIEP